MSIITRLDSFYYFLSAVKYTARIFLIIVHRVSPAVGYHRRQQFYFSPSVITSANAIVMFAFVLAQLPLSPSSSSSSALRYIFEDGSWEKWMTNSSTWPLYQSPNYWCSLRTAHRKLYQSPDSGAVVIGTYLDLHARRTFRAVLKHQSVVAEKSNDNDNDAQ